MDFLGNILNFLNPFSKEFILKDVLNFFADIISYINPFSENFFGYKLIEFLGDLLKKLFVPSEERINAINNTISSKFNFVESIKIAINSLKDLITGVGGAPKITLNLGATQYTESGNYTILDLSFYAPFKNFGDVVLTGIIYAFFIWRLFISAPNIIRGVGGAVQGDYMVSDIKAYNRFGFGRSSGLDLHQGKGGGVYRK